MTDITAETTPELTLPDVLRHIIALLPVREESHAVALINAVEKARPKLEALLAETVPAVEEAVTVAGNAAKIVEGL